MSKLFSPLEIKGSEIGNRIVLPPMATERSQPDGAVKPESIAYYGAMAARGMGLLIVEHNFIAPEGRASPGQMSIADDRALAGHRELAGGIRARGVCAALQVSHSGSNRQETVSGECLGPSPVAHPSSRLTPRELSAGEIAGIVAAFGSAAARGKQAGYDMVEIHCAHGYLLGQFLSPLTNRRGDRYGGNGANCRRLLMEVIEEAKGRVGADYPLMLRLGVSDNPPGMEPFPGGLELGRRRRRRPGGRRGRYRHPGHIGRHVRQPAAGAGRRSVFPALAASPAPGGARTPGPHRRHPRARDRGGGTAGRQRRPGRSGPGPGRRPAVDLPGEKTIS